MQRDFATFVGIDLGGARGKTTAVARLALSDDRLGGVLVEDVSPRCRASQPWRDEVLIDYLAELAERPGGCVVAINAPLTLPACVRCVLPVCPGQEACADPAVEWLRGTGAELVDAALAADRDRIVAIPTSGGLAGRSLAPTTRPRGPRLEPYVHRGAEVVMHFERALLPREVLGTATGRVAARGVHLRRLLAGRGFRLNQELLEVSPRATVKALFGRHKARGYKRDADPWQTRAAIVEELADMRFGASSRLSREEVLRNDHCFEALLSGYTAYLWARDGWAMPEGDQAALGDEGWIWAPPT